MPYVNPLVQLARENRQRYLARIRENRLFYIFLRAIILFFSFSYLRPFTLTKKNNKARLRHKRESVQLISQNSGYHVLTYSLADTNQDKILIIFYSRFVNIPDIIIF